MVLLAFLQDVAAAVAAQNLLAHSKAVLSLPVSQNVALSLLASQNAALRSVAQKNAAQNDSAAPAAQTVTAKTALAKMGT